MNKIFYLVRAVIFVIFAVFSPIFLFSQKNGIIGNPTNASFNFAEIAEKLNYNQDLNQVKRTVKVGILIEENGDENNINYNNLKQIFQFFSPNSNLIIYRFKTSEQWLDGIKHLETSGVEIVLHLYKDDREFLAHPLPSNGQFVKFGDFLDRWTEKTGILHFFDGEKTVGDEIFSNFVIFAKVDDKFKNSGKFFNYAKIFGNGYGVSKSNHFVVPELNFNYQLNSGKATVDFYPIILLGALFSQLSSSFDSYDNLKNVNQKILIALSLTAKPSENTNLGFNGTHINEGFGHINFKNAFLTLEQGNFIHNKFDGSTYTSAPFELIKGQEFSAMIFHDKFSQKSVEIIESAFSAFFRKIYNSISKIFTSPENPKLNDFDISIEIFRGGWTKIIEANSEISPFDKIYFRAFEDAQYRIKVTNADFIPGKPSTYFLAWKKYPIQLRVQEKNT
ncbi:hypothetical protein [Mycoplasma sp. 'Moose RK']|uniref:hypothetical protein n=1 Tax=Mycoplasma sp. 'Moose RK' TaxID=2780095 RepID=UPI0018C30EE5|nr:hypothetical protein [Mycoplasma sp. 'Moose RK']MBG0730551.1 hypothetical protein [Mycoplasma sp. 'Moose RK']